MAKATSARSRRVPYLPMTWLPSLRLRDGEANSREFAGLTGRAGLTTLNNPLNIDRSATPSRSSDEPDRT